MDFWESLARKWQEVPGDISSRVSSTQLLDFTDQQLVSKWDECVRKDTTDSGFAVRGWYHHLYKDILKGKKVADIGSGFGIDGISFALAGAQVTFVDIVKSNLTVLERICDAKKVSNVSFLYMDNIASLMRLPRGYDVIWCQGSLINVPRDIARLERHELLLHLKENGRWIELTYPKSRWIKDWCPPFTKWGEKTDGKGTPYVRWYELKTILEDLAPTQFRVLLDLCFYHRSFNWFDLQRIA